MKKSLKKFSLLVAASVLAFSMFLVSSPASVSAAPQTVTTESDFNLALADPSCEKIILGSNITLGSQITIDRPVEIDGANNVLTADFTKTGSLNNSAIGVLRVNGAVTIKDITIEAGSSASELHGVNVFGVTDLQLNNVKINDFSFGTYKYGLVVNGSDTGVPANTKVTLNGLVTTGNDLSVNVDGKYSSTGPVELAVISYVNNESNGIIVDGGVPSGSNQGVQVDTSQSVPALDTVTVGGQDFYVDKMDAPTITSGSVFYMGSTALSTPWTHGAATTLNYDLHVYTSEADAISGSGATVYNVSYNDLFPSSYLTGSTSQELYYRVAATNILNGTDSSTGLPFSIPYVSALSADYGKAVVDKVDPQIAIDQNQSAAGSQATAYKAIGFDLQDDMQLSSFAITDQANNNVYSQNVSGKTFKVDASVISGLNLKDGNYSIVAYDMVGNSVSFPFVFNSATVNTQAGEKTTKIMPKTGNNTGVVLALTGIMLTAGVACLLKGKKENNA